MARLILFDIDLTLIATLGAGRRAMAAAYRRLYGIGDCTNGIHFDGRTDRAIFMEALDVHGIGNGQREDAYRAVCHAYVEELPAALTEQGGRVLPGVVPLLDALRTQEAAIGLATGNQVRGAQAKLGHYGLWDRFATGGFGDELAVRSDVVRMAIRNVASAANVDADPCEAIVIGDTPLDVQAAHEAGARALAVATGSYGVEQLRKSDAEWVLDDLGDTERVLEMLLD